MECIRKLPVKKNKVMITLRLGSSSTQILVCTWAKEYLYFASQAKSIMPFKCSTHFRSRKQKAPYFENLDYTESNCETELLRVFQNHNLYRFLSAGV